MTTRASLLPLLSSLALSLGASLGLDSESLKSLGLSALLYDLGTVRVPEDRLTEVWAAAEKGR